MQYAIVIERQGSRSGAYVPDLPGCVAVGESESEVPDLITDAIALHVDALRREGGLIPAPSARVEYVRIAEAA
jgi:predicted RNase H-like HicB family nuclease